MVVKETLRRYPLQALISRTTTNDYFLPQESEEGKDGSTKILAGTEVQIHMAGIQLDPKHYPDPEKFNPENFAPENVSKRPR